MPIEIIEPDWPAPANIRACATTRIGGVSPVPYHSLNLGDHVGDQAGCVAENRARLRAQFQLPREPVWLKQVHGTRVVQAGEAGEADACWSDRVGYACAVLTADCLPVLFCDDRGERFAAAHAGWRGLAAGVLEATVDALGVEPERLVAWLGPAIGPSSFEIGEEVRSAFLARDAGAEPCFRRSPRGRWLADLYQLARRRLAARGVRAVHGGGLCTYRDQSRFYSYRRDGETGRMATLIWRLY